MAVISEGKYWTKDSNLLVVVVDINPFQWAKCPLPLSTAVKQIAIFLNAYLALKPQNQLAIIASSVDRCQFIYPKASQLEPNTNKVSLPTVYHQFRVIDETIMSDIISLVNDEAECPQNDRSTSMTACAISRGLCYINRVLKADKLTKIHSRLLVLSVSGDSSIQYIPIMNSIFSAQKSNILIDVAKIFGEDSVFLQQASDITQANYVRLNDPRGLLQHLMVSFLPDHFTRNYVYLPGKDQVDFRAACFCHKRIISVGYVCSVCLSIFCEYTPVCSTCESRFSNNDATKFSDKASVVKSKPAA